MAERPGWEAWVRYAENDWAFALEGLERFPAQAGFLLHQAAEKYLKAVLIRDGTTPPRTHDLRELLRLTGGGGAEDNGLEWSAARLLWQLMPTNRYPGDLPEPTVDEARPRPGGGDATRPRPIPAGAAASLTEPAAKL